MAKAKGISLSFRIQFKTHWGQSIFVSGSSKKLGAWQESKALELTPIGEDLWEGSIAIDEDSVSYKYFVGSGEHKEWEFGDNRELHFSEGYSYQIEDAWRSRGDAENNLFRSPFLKAFFNRAPSKPKKQIQKENEIHFRLSAVRVPDSCTIGLLGSSKALGSWDPKKVLLLEDHGFPIWEVRVPVSKAEILEYKYVLVEKKSKKLLGWESGSNRRIHVESSKKPSVHLKNDIHFRYPEDLWRGAGVAIPIFSLRSKKSTGIGEFADLKVFTDWAVNTGLKVIQVLPVNDTTALYKWTDSYPYASISVQALHPIYISLHELGKLKDLKKQKAIDAKSKKLNDLPEVDYEEVIRLKMDFLREKYSESFSTLQKSSEFLAFVAKNESWLKPYAVFCALRDKNGTPDFREWKEHSSIDSKSLDSLADKKSKIHDDVMLYYFIQFHLDKQLQEATNYAREHGVVLKGDIPIGIYRNSVEAWWEPHLFHMDKQAGAPPDDFSITGQNWGFPTYNWEVMEENGFKWWTRRLTKMSEYFDIIRIDHILGFFRIWEIPIDQVDGLLGRFNPALPFTADEIRQWGIDFDFDRYCKPYIRTHMVHQIFQSHAQVVFEKYLDEQAPGVYHLKEEYNTQQKIRREFEDRNNNDTSDFSRWMKFNLYRLVSEVLFLESEPGKFCPRVGFHSTYSFGELSDNDKNQLDRLYNHFFYHRHNEFWREKAMRKLPALKNASNMLICGEDLGMVPASVPGVMQELNILSLAVQRMPNDDREFWHPSDTPYESVTTTSSHDTSTLREWWQEDPERSREFYQKILGRFDDPPFFLEPDLARDITNQHMYSPSMWAIFPIQDLLAMDADLRRERPEDERINVPANPMHYWRYRMHIFIEDLIDNQDFNRGLRSMVSESGRIQ